MIAGVSADRNFYPKKVRNKTERGFAPPAQANRVADAPSEARPSTFNGSLLPTSLPITGLRSRHGCPVHLSCTTPTCRDFVGAAVTIVEAQSYPHQSFDVKRAPALFQHVSNRVGFVPAALPLP